MKKNLLIVLFGRSCVGKTTMVRKIQKLYGNQIHEAVSVTTRQPRPTEIPGQDYNFITKEKFDQMLAEKELVEDIEYNGNYYGLAYSAFDTSKTNIAIIEPNGLKQVKEKMADIFEILIVKMDENDYTLLERFKKRGDPIEVREKRIYGDKTHFAEIPFDYLINSELLLFEAILKNHTDLRYEDECI
jgi:guanylate kinase